MLSNEHYINRNSISILTFWIFYNFTPLSYTDKVISLFDLKYNYNDNIVRKLAELAVLESARVCVCRRNVNDIAEIAEQLWFSMAFFSLLLIYKAYTLVKSDIGRPERRHDSPVVKESVKNRR